MTSPNWMTAEEAAIELRLVDRLGRPRTADARKFLAKRPVRTGRLGRAVRYWREHVEALVEITREVHP